MEILIVDDEPVSRAALKTLVEKLPDCRVREFAEAAAALSWCEANRPAVVIVGYVMPDLNGIEFTRAFRKLAGAADIPVLMVTANTDRDVRNQAFEIGVNDFLNKPYDSVELQTRVANMLALGSKQSYSQHAPVRHQESSKTGVAQPQRLDLLLDLDLTRKRLADDETLLRHVARVFVRTVPELLNAVRTALAANDSERAYAEAHSLKGAVAVFEAPRVLEAIVAVEAHANNYNAAAAQSAFVAAQALVERLASELSLMYPQDSRAA